MELAIALTIIAAAVFFLIRGLDVRLVLFTAGWALALVGGTPGVVFQVFLREMGNGDTIGPICSAMGYAFVLKATGCDREMVRLLLAPVRRIRWLLVPAGCVVGFVTNTTITSQTASAAAVGAVLIPLMKAAGYHPIVSAATLVLGCSGGGSLYNPGDADLVAIQKYSGQPMEAALQTMFLPLLLGFAAAAVTFVIFSLRQPMGNAVAAEPTPEALDGKIHWVKALLPPLPLVLIFLSLPTFNLLPGFESVGGKGLPVSHAMIMSTMVVLLVDRQEVSAKTKAFFEGLGFAYVNVISLIITAACFIAGMKAVGLIGHLVSFVSDTGLLGKLATAFFPWSLAVLCGSGIAPAVAFCEAVLPSVARTDPQGALDLGVLATIAATFGRTMSPVSAVVIFSATLAGVTPNQIIRRTGPPLMVGLMVVVVVISFR